MCKIFKLALVASLLPVCAPPAAAQEPAAQRQGARKFKYKGKIKTQYDRAKDETLVLLWPLTLEQRDGSVEAVFPAEGGAVRRLPGEILQAMAYFTYPGKTFAAPEFVTLGFKATVYERRVLNDGAELVVESDGERVTLGRVRLTGRSPSTAIQTERLQYYDELVELPVTRELFTRLVNARKVRASLDGRWVSIPENHLEALRDLAGRAAPVE